MEKQEQIEQVEYSKKELQQRAEIMDCADKARNQKQQAYDEFDGMDYDTWYLKSKRAAQAYIEPKINDEDVRVVTGTTREKGNILVNTLLKYNFEADITAFDDKDNKLQEEGQLMEKMVRKSRELENPRYDMKRALIYLELVNQGNVFVEEAWEEYQIPEKELKELDWSEGVDPRKIDWKEKLNKVFGACNSRILTGKDIYVGNVREFFMELQPYVIKRRVMSRAVAQAVYGKWIRWKNVPINLFRTTQLENDKDGYDDYQMIETEASLVEEVMYYNKWTNTYQIMLNGVLMLPVGFPLSALLGVSEYPIAKGDCEPISAKFFWSRGIGSKAKMEQALLDEFMKMAVIKGRKSYKPPMANTGNYNVDSKIFLSGSIVKGVDPDKLKPIGDNNGVTAADFNMIQFVKQIIDEKTVSPVLEGNEPRGSATARQIVEQKEQSMVKIGMTVLGVVNLEQRMAWMRICNILKHWTMPVDKRIKSVKTVLEDKEVEGTEEENVYRSINMDDTIENGRAGERQMEFTESIPEDSQVYAEEELLTKIKGKPVRKHYMDVKKWASLRNKWQVEITPTEKTTDALKTVMFEEAMMKLLQVFPPLGKMPDVNYLGDEYARRNDLDPEKVFPEEQQKPQGGGNPMEQLAQQMGAQGGGGQLAQQMTPSQPQQPSINTMVQGGGV